MNSQTVAKIANLLDTVMHRLITRRIEETFNAEELEISNPFGNRLLPPDIWKAAKLERSFVTILGQGVFEQLAQIIAEGSGALAIQNKNERIIICTHRDDKINEILHGNRKKGSAWRQPDWDKDVETVLAANNNSYKEITIQFDLYIKRNGKEEYYSMKTVKPNLDQTEIAKRDMLTIIAGKTNCEAYFALPFNPAGEGKLYRECGHTIPYKLFNMDTDRCVLIGSNFWNKIGNSNSTYNDLLDIFEKVGEKYKVIIEQQYLKK